MANRWLYAGADLSCVRAVGALTADNGGSRQDSNYVDGHLLCTTAIYFYADFVDSSIASDSVVSGETLWVVAVVSYLGQSTAGNLIEVVDGSDQPWVAVRITAANTAGLYYNSGTGGSPTWTQIGSSFTLATGLSTLQLSVTLGSPHSATLYLAGVSQASNTFTQASFTGADALRCASNSTTTVAFSEIAASVGINLIGCRVNHETATGAGATSGWTGLFSTIDEYNINDADLISSGTAAQKSTFAWSNVQTLPGGFALGDIFLSVRAKNDGAAPNNVKPVRRTGGVDNVGSSFAGMGTGFADFKVRYAALSESDFNGSEFGVESAT